MSRIIQLNTDRLRYSKLVLFYYFRLWSYFENWSRNKTVNVTTFLHFCGRTHHCFPGSLLEWWMPRHYLNKNELLSPQDKIMNVSRLVYHHCDPITNLLVISRLDHTHCSLCRWEPLFQTPDLLPVANAESHTTFHFSVYCNCSLLNPVV